MRRRGPSRDDIPRGDELLAKLRELGEPEYRVFAAGRRSDDEIEQALQWRFRVFRKLESPTELRPPIDWDMDPLGSRPWRAQLQAQRFLDILFKADRQGHGEALPMAREIALDWIAANAPGEERMFAWADKIAGDRVPYYCYLLRAAGARGLVDAEQASVLLDSIVEHGRFLADPENYTASSNHGLFEDAGLVLLANYLPFLPQSDEWRALAVDRFTDSVRAHVSAEAVHLEHSPGYHKFVVETIRKFQALGEVESPALDELLAEMQRVGAWFVLPDGCLPPVGDTEQIPAPEWALDGVDDAQGVATFPEAGIAVVRERGDYVYVAANHHSHVHKHGDDASFIYHHGALEIVGEAGKFGYEPSDPGRVYARSATAHNGLVVDGRDLLWQGHEPYGSGIRGSANSDGWTAIRAVNPLVADLGVTHERLLLVRPGAGLVVVDSVQAEEEHDYLRYVHFGPELEAAESAGEILLAGPGISGRVVDCGPQRSGLELVRGRREPFVQGWTFPGYREWRPVWALELASREADALFALAISLGPLAVDAVDRDDGGYRLELRLDGEPVSLTVGECGGALALATG